MLYIYQPCSLIAVLSPSFKREDQSLIFPYFFYRRWGRLLKTVVSPDIQRPPILGLAFGSSSPRKSFEKPTFTRILFFLFPQEFLFQGSVGNFYLFHFFFLFDRVTSVISLLPLRRLGIKVHPSSNISITKQ